MSLGPTLTIVENPDALAEAATRAIAEAAAEAIADHGRFTIALAGGETPRATYMRLATPLPGDRIPWEHTWVFFGDERCVPPEHPESNYRLAHETLVGKVPIPATQVFRIRGELEDAEAAAAEYARTLATVFETRRGELPRFDLILLGMGLDGHTASLFPGSPALKEIFRPVAAVHATAAAIPQRLTLTYPVLNAAARVIFLVSGAVKAKTVKAALSDGSMLPAALVRPTTGSLVWMLDRPAASRL